MLRSKNWSYFLLGVFKKNKYNVLIVFMLLCDLLLWDMGQVRELFASMSRLIASVFTCRHFEKKKHKKNKLKMILKM